MRLSEAIRLGSMMKPQAFGAFYVTPQWRSNGPLGLSLLFPEASCALGAALDAVGYVHDPSEDDVNYPDEWDALVDSSALCPVCAARKTVWTAVFHLNDDHRWTRERIADWVEQFETLPEPIDTLPIDVQYEEKINAR